MDGFGLARKGETELECPFCQKGKVKVFHKEGYLQAKTSRISNRAKTKYYKTLDTYEVLEDCPSCGKKRKEIQKAFDGKISTSSRGKPAKISPPSGATTKPACRSYTKTPKKISAPASKRGAARRICSTAGWAD